MFIMATILSHDLYASPLLVSLFLLSPLLIFICFFFTRTSSSPPKLNLPPSPPGLPVLGNLHQLGQSLHRSLRDLSEQHASRGAMLLRLGRAPTLVVSSAEALRELIKSHDVAVSNRPPTRAASELFYGGKNMGFAPFGEYWKRARRITAQELLSPTRVHQFRLVREQEAAGLVERLRRDAGSSSPAVNLSRLVLETANGIVSRCVTGNRRSSEAAEIVKKVMVLVTGTFCVGDFVPELRWIDALRGFGARLRSTFREVDAFLERVIDEREALMLDGKASGDGFDGKLSYYLVDVLLQLQKDGSSDFELTRDNVKAFLLDMLVGGTDSTSVVIEWLMAELVRNPSSMKKAQEEVRRVVGKKPKIDTNDMNHMKYLKCVIKETLRLHPPSPLLAPREASNDIEIGGYHVPAKTRLFINAWAIQRDGDFWERPDEFFPERFENNSIDFKGQDCFEFVPFGCGRRGCPGMAFGVASVEYITANLLHWFDWKLPGNGDSGIPEDLDMSEDHGFLVHKKVPLHLVPILVTF